MKLKIFGLIVLIVGLIISLDLGKKVSQLLSEASAKKAEIVVEADKELGKMPRPWNSYGQGGETSDGMLQTAVSQMKSLSPDYIRIDHIYDFYEVVQKENGSLRFSFDKLDKEVEAILASGAKPFLALSYMPPAMANNVTDQPNNWGEWQALVKATIEHYSGKQNKNISNVYYEVWNEPDLFGNWKMSGEKNYLELYRQSAIAAEKAGNVQPFKLGGPATTGLYKNWTEGLFKFINDENLRFDFVSWHRYSLNPDGFVQDVESLSRILSRYPRLALKERVISEWGPDAKNHPAYDNQIGAAHAVAAAREMLGIINKAIVFEIKDGLNPEGKAFWGRWGLMTHEKTGLQLKPRYKAFLWLNEIGETRVRLTGEGSFVKGIAAKKGEEIQINLVNFDPYNAHQEAVPVIVKNLPPGNYQVVRQDFEGKKLTTEVTITQGTWAGQVLLGPNDIVRLGLKKI